MLGVLVCTVLLFHGSRSSEAGRTQPHTRAVDLPWRDELCCGPPSARRRSVSSPPAPSTVLPACRYRRVERTSEPGGTDPPAGGLCWSVWCAVDDHWERVVCHLKSGSRPAERQAVSAAAELHLQRLELQRGHDGGPEVSRPAGCVTGRPLVCSIALDNAKPSVATVTIAALNASAPTVWLRVPGRPVRPAPPLNVTHTQTVRGQLVLGWAGPAARGRCEVRYTVNSTNRVWQVLDVSGEPQAFLDLKPRLNYTCHVRCSLLGQPPLWSAWSPPHHIYLDTVSYVPEVAVVAAGQNVTVFCVFNEHGANASTAAWSSNLKHPVPAQQYAAVGPRVSQVTVLPSQNRLYDLLQCTQEWKLPYSQIYVEGAAINIMCETNGDIDTMTCRWETHLTTLQLFSRWADLPCEEMQRREAAGRVAGEPRRLACRQGRQSETVKSCPIHPLRMSCYRLWLEEDSKLGPVRSRAVYVSPLDHVKPHRPSGVEALTQQGGVLTVRWRPPALPVEGVRCQVRHHAPSAVSPRPEWRVQGQTGPSWAQVPLADMCRVYEVQVRCIPTRGAGSWSDWTESVYSVPQNSRVPDHGPDFWRVLEEDPHRNVTNVTLLLKRPEPRDHHSYCVDGFIVQHQTSGGSIVSRKIALVSSYSFEWDRQEVHTLTVEAFNSLGSSTSNTNMTLGRRAKRRCVETFFAEVINSSCVSLLWSLRSSSSPAPLAMVVQWSALRPRDGVRTGPGGDLWARLPFTQHAQYLSGNFVGAEQYMFTVFPVFADGEGEAAYSTATRGSPAAHLLLTIITFLSVVLFVALVLSQNQMRRWVWKDIPNPYHCSWAKELDLHKANTTAHLLQLPDLLPGWPLLLPAESFCEALIVDKRTPQPPPTALDQDQAPDQAQALDQVPAVSVTPGSAPSTPNTVFSITSTSLSPGSAPLAPGSAPLAPGGVRVSSSQSSVTYSTLLHRGPSARLSYNSDGGGGGGGSSSDEGNFSDISGSFRGGLWELEGCQDGGRRSCSFYSVEESSATSEQEEEDKGVSKEKELYYLGMGEGVGEEREETQLVQLQSLSSGPSVLLIPEGDAPKRPVDPTPVYLPQFKTALCQREPRRRPPPSVGHSPP